QSEELLDLRMACLSQRREELKSLVDVLLKPNAQMVADSLRSVQGVTELQTCANTSALFGPLRPPPNAESRAKVEELRQKLDRFKGNKLAGKPSEKLPLLTGIVEEARALQYRPLEAEALRQLGGLHSEMGALEDARRTLLDAVFAAEAAGHTYEAEQAWA